MGTCAKEYQGKREVNEILFPFCSIIMNIYHFYFLKAIFEDKKCQKYNKK